MKRNRSLGTLSSTLLIFSIAILVVAPGAWAQSKFKTLHTFQGGKDGSDPTDSLIFDREGNLYGTTSLGGNPPYGGTVFKLKPNADGSWKKSVLYTFCSLDNCVDGGEPIAGLV